MTTSCARLIPYVLFFVLPLLAEAQVQVSARLDSTEIRIGSQTKVLLEAKIAGENYVNFPRFSPLDTVVAGVEVVGVGDLDISFDNTVQSQELTLTSFEAGEYLLNFSFLVNNNTQQTANIPLVVRGVQVDTVASALRDIKPVYEVPLGWQTVLQYILIIMGTILLSGVVGYYLWKKWRKKPVAQEQQEETPPLPPHILAVQQLDALQAAGLPAKGETKAFYIRLTDVLREYLAARFGIEAQEMTTDEMMDALQENEEWRMKNEDSSSASAHSTFYILHSTLKLADLVKFAKTKPSDQDNEQSLKNGYLLIEETKK